MQQGLAFTEIYRLIDLMFNFLVVPHGRPKLEAIGLAWTVDQFLVHMWLIHVYTTTQDDEISPDNC